MLRKLLKNKKAQNTAEYAILISLVVAGIIAMQTYAQRALQARVRDASQYMVDTINLGDKLQQYEPYYLNTSYNVIRDESTGQVLTDAQMGGITAFENSTRGRQEGGFSDTLYNGEKGF